MPRRLTREEFINKAKEIHGDFYDYSNVEYINSNTPVRIICPIHGEFEQLPSVHINKKRHGCPSCMRDKLSLLFSNSVDEFINRAKEIHGDKYDYSEVNYLNNRTKVKIKCNRCGAIFFQTPHAHIDRKQGCPYCYGNARKTTDKFISEAEAKHPEYDYSEVNYINNKTKVKIICPVHGPFFIKPNSFLRETNHGCPKCSGKYHYNTSEFINRAREVHGYKYDYSKVNYVSSHELVEIICNVHGPFKQKAYGHLFGYGCPECAKKSKGEEKISSYLQKHCIRYIHDKACLDFLERMRPDFYLPDYNLIIEYDGIQHFDLKKTWKNFSYEKLHEKDLLKDELCIKNGVNVIRIPFTDYNYIDDILDLYL